MIGAPDVGDFLADFAEANDWRTSLKAREGTYEVLRLGSAEILSGADVPISQRYQLVIKCLDTAGVNARFSYRDIGNKEKPPVNKYEWSGRIVDANGIFFLVGITEAKSDAALFVLWNHPRDKEVLVGLQLAKLEPGKDATDRRPYAVSRRIVAIKSDRRRKVDLEEKKRWLDWLRQEPRGLLEFIEPVRLPGNTE